jgi:small subunit ribosomal protein S20
MRSALRELRTALTSGDKKTLDVTFRETVSELDKSVQKGVLHKNTASRYKSRLAARVKAAATK